MRVPGVQNCELLFGPGGDSHCGPEKISQM